MHQALDALLGPTTRTNAPNGTSLVTRPGTTCPIWWILANCCHGSSWSGLQRQRDALAVHVHVEDLDRDLLADLNHLARVVDVLPGQLGDVHEAVHAAEIDEGAEVDDRGHHAGADLALEQGGEEGVAHLRTGSAQASCATGEDDVVAVLVELDDLRLERPAHVGLQVADPAHLHQRQPRREAAQADVEDPGHP